MQLYKISDEGELIKLELLKFLDNDVYLVDDEENHTIYIWVGISVLQKKKDITAELARNLDKERGGSAKILIMKQKREYGSFLAMMHDLKKGDIPGKTIERRPEFRFEVALESKKSTNISKSLEEKEIKMETRITEWFIQLNKYRKSVSKEETIEEIKEPEEIQEREVEEESDEPDLKTQVRETAYFLSLDKYSYNELCWLLAEKIQKMNLPIPSIEDIRKKAEEVFNSSCTYDELCWLNAEMDVLTKKSLLEEAKKKPFDY
jgi:hypothetical protein